MLQSEARRSYEKECIRNFPIFFLSETVYEILHVWCVFTFNDKTQWQSVHYPNLAQEITHTGYYHRHMRVTFIHFFFSSMIDRAIKNFVMEQCVHGLKPFQTTFFVNLWSNFSYFYERNFRKVSKVFQGCFIEVLRVFQECFQSVSRNFDVCFNKFS